MKEDIERLSRKRDNCDAFLRYWNGLGFNEHNDFVKELVKALATVWSKTE